MKRKMHAFARGGVPRANAVSPCAVEFARKKSGKSRPARLIAPARNTSRRLIGATAKKSRQAVGTRMLMPIKVRSTSAAIKTVAKAWIGIARSKVPFKRTTRERPATQPKTCRSWCRCRFRRRRCQLKRCPNIPSPLRNPRKSSDIGRVDDSTLASVSRFKLAAAVGCGISQFSVCWRLP